MQLLYLCFWCWMTHSSGIFQHVLKPYWAPSLSPLTAWTLDTTFWKVRAVQADKESRGYSVAHRHTLHHTFKNTFTPFVTPQHSADTAFIIIEGLELRYCLKQGALEWTAWNSWWIRTLNSYICFKKCVGVVAAAGIQVYTRKLWENSSSKCFKVFWWAWTCLRGFKF